MSSRAVDYDALEATTSVEGMTYDDDNQEILQLLKDDHGDFPCLCISEEVYGNREYLPYSSEELGWLGHFAKKSAHLVEFSVEGDKAFNNCSQQSVDRFFEDIGKCNRIRKLHFFGRNDLTEIMRKLDPAIKNNNIKHWSSEGCHLGETEVNHIFTAFRDMAGLEELSIQYYGIDEHDLNDDIMAGCIPSLAACTRMQKLKLILLDLSTSSCAALSAVFPRMAALHKLVLGENSIGNDGVEVLIRGLAECKQLHSVRLYDNRIGDFGLGCSSRVFLRVSTLWIWQVMRSPSLNSYRY